MKKMKRYLEKTRELTKVKGYNKFRVYLQLAYFSAIKRIWISEYFAYDFYNLNRHGRKKFLTAPRNAKIKKKFNNKIDNETIDNKNLFNSKMMKYVNRDWIYIKESNETEIKIFLSKHKFVFMKPNDGSLGDGAFMIKSEFLLQKNIKEEYANYIMEEVIVQHVELDKLNNKSINTIRIITTKNNSGYVSIIAATLRIGRQNSVIDNLNKGGLAAKIDVNNGVIITPAKDKKLNVYITHPDSNELLLGFKIPNWDKITKGIKEAAKEFKYNRYIGWDVAVTNDGFVVVEANTSPSPDLIQMNDQKGLYYEILKGLKGE